MRHYSPSQPPLSDDTRAVAQWVFRELQRIASTMLTLHDLNEHVDAPDHVAKGMIRVADGTGWNPGSGAGLYYYDGSSWTKLN